jgi:hypothetical protein
MIRDLKEENLIMVGDKVKLLDFGSATTKCNLNYKFIAISYKTTKIKDMVNEEIDLIMNTSHYYR